MQTSVHFITNEHWFRLKGDFSRFSRFQPPPSALTFGWSIRIWQICCHAERGCKTSFVRNDRAFRVLFSSDNHQRTLRCFLVPLLITQSLVCDLSKFPKPLRHSYPDVDANGTANIINANEQHAICYRITSVNLLSVNSVNLFPSYHLLELITINNVTVLFAHNSYLYHRYYYANGLFANRHRGLGTTSTLRKSSRRCILTLGNHKTASGTFTS